MRQAIVTQYLGPTNNRGSRVKASAEVGSVTLSWDYGLSPSENHKLAALALANKYEWSTFDWHGGGTKTGYVWVQVSK